MLILAESIDGAIGLFVGFVAISIFPGLVSFWPAIRGHWSALLLAAPSILGGLMLMVDNVRNSSPEPIDASIWIYSAIPLAIGVLSILVWWTQRRTRRV